MNCKLGLAAWILIAGFAIQARGNEPLPALAAAELPRLLAEINPQPGESPWREIPWLTNVTEARQRAIAEDKPIVIFTAADGSPLSRT
jgi:hypothetical protein